jgi:hypothetical protein
MAGQLPCTGHERALPSLPGMLQSWSHCTSCSFPPSNITVACFSCPYHLLGTSLERARYSVSAPVLQVSGNEQSCKCDRNKP